jgi:hypothetical protein
LGPFLFSSIDEETSAHLLHSKAEQFLGGDGNDLEDLSPRV